MKELVENNDTCDSPTEDIKEREVTPSEIEKVAKQIFYIMHPYRLPSDCEPKYDRIAEWHLSDLTTKLAALKEENEKLVKAASTKAETCYNIHEVVISKLRAENKSQAGRIIELMEHSVSELAVLKRENDRLNVINNGMMDNLKMWQSANAVFNKEITTLRTENQELVKEVERLREVLNQCRCALGGYKMTHRLHEESVLNKALAAAQEALKPTPEDKQ